MSYPHPENSFGKEVMCYNIFLLGKLTGYPQPKTAKNNKNKGQNFNNMAYKNIHWIKLEKRLLNDYRFYTMSEDAQLIYVKLLMLAADTGNRMVRSGQVLRQALRCTLQPTQLQECINEIRVNFPKFRSNRYYYYFKDFDNRLNWVEKDKKKEFPGSSQGVAGDGVDKIRIDKKRKEEKRVSSSKVKPYFRGNEMRKSKGRWWVLPDDGGTWLEFAGKEDEIEWK